MPAFCRIHARHFVPPAAIRAQPLRHPEMPAFRSLQARLRVPRAAVRAQRLQLFELSTPLGCLTKVFLTRQETSPLQALHRA